MLIAVLAAGVLGLQAALHGVSAPLRPGHDAAWVRQRAQALQPTAQERRWERIGWVHSLEKALRLGRERGRPIYLFAILGRMECSRN